MLSVPWQQQLHKICQVRTLKCKELVEWKWTTLTQRDSTYLLNLYWAKAFTHSALTYGQWDASSFGWLLAIILSKKTPQSQCCFGYLRLSVLLHLRSLNAQPWSNNVQSLQHLPSILIYPDGPSQWNSKFYYLLVHLTMLLIFSDRCSN